MSGTHDNIIANAAKKVLQPLGLRRKGQSRLWLGDHVWWLTVVEFQPSGFGKGSYLNVAAHWLWSEGGYISFDLGSRFERGSRVAEFEEYRSDDHFAAAADRLATAAAQEAQELAQRLPTIQAAAGLLLRQEASIPAQSRGGWSTYHAGVAAGLADRGSEADAMLRSVTDDRIKAAAERFARLLPEPARFKEDAALLVAKQRKALRLPELNAPPF